MEWLAEFMGWKRSPITNVDISYCNPDDPFSLFKIDPPSWNIWMEQVEPKIREKGLWGAYLSELLRDSNAWETTLEQRAEALRRVSERS